MIDFGSDTVIAIVSIATLIIIVGGGIYWFGKLVNRVDQLERKVDQLAEDMRDLREEMRSQRNELLEAMQNQRSELLEEMRRGNQQLLIALANHGHDDGGQPVFRVPVGAE